MSIFSLYIDTTTRLVETEAEVDDGMDRSDEDHVPDEYDQTTLSAENPDLPGNSRLSHLTTDEKTSVMNDPVIPDDLKVIVDVGISNLNWT